MYSIPEPRNSHGSYAACRGHKERTKTSIEPNPPARFQQSRGCSPSLQHDVLEVLLQDGVLDSVEHEANVLCVDGRGEVVEQGFAAVPSLPVKALHQVTLHVLQPVRVALEVREILLNAHSLYLLHEKIHLVEE